MKKVSVKKVYVAGAATIVGFLALFLLVEGAGVFNRIRQVVFGCDGDCYDYTFINRHLYLHDHGDGRAYVINTITGEKTLKNVAWIAKPQGSDSLICFSDGKKRGYFSKNTGKIVVEPKYDRAWIFSEGIASVEENGFIKFIDQTGKVIIDKKMPYITGMQGYVFHGGYCIVDSDDGRYCGLMDRAGNIVVPLEYSFIRPYNDLEHWVVEKDKEATVLGKNLLPLFPMTECSVSIDEGFISVTMADHTIRQYDMEGKLINDFYIIGTRLLEYKKDEILYRTETRDEDGEEYAVPVINSYHPLATARLRAYIAGDFYEGLMAADGHIVTMPLYKNIEAIGPDLYLCTCTNSDKVVVNSKGVVVR